MTQAGYHDANAIFLGHQVGVLFLERLGKLVGQVADPEGMLETGVGGIRIDEMAGPNLFEKPQPLELLRVHDGHGDGRERDVAVNAEKTFDSALVILCDVVNCLPVIDDFFLWLHEVNVYLVFGNRSAPFHDLQKVSWLGLFCRRADVLLRVLGRVDFEVAVSQVAALVVVVDGGAMPL